MFQLKSNENNKNEKKAVGKCRILLNVARLRNQPEAKQERDEQT